MIILTQDALKNVFINTLFSIFSSKTPPYKLIISVKTAWQKSSCGYCCYLCICLGKMAVIDVNASSWWQLNHLQESKYVFINDRSINFHIKYNLFSMATFLQIPRFRKVYLKYTFPIQVQIKYIYHNLLNILHLYFLCWSLN